MSDEPSPRLRLPSASTPDPEALARLRRFHYEAGSVGRAETAPFGEYRSAFPRLPEEEGEKAQAAEPLADLSSALRAFVDLAAERTEGSLARFTSEAAPVMRSLRARLDADGTSSGAIGGEGEKLAHGLGNLATRFLDPAALAERVKSTTVTEPLEPARRARFELALGRLENGDGPSESSASGKASRSGAIRVICESDLAERYGLSSSGVSRLELAAVPCVVAAQCFDDEAARVAARIAALRVARLELEGCYEPERHDLALEHFDWQAFHRDELELLPTVLAIVSADHIAGAGMASLSRLLLSGRPVQVVVVVEPAASPGSADRSGFRFEPGYLGLGHREALVHQSSPAAPSHLRSGFERALDGTRTSLHVLAADPGATALDSRAHPLFLFDPEAGDNWTDRFDLEGNPARELDWPLASLEIQPSDPAAGDATLDLAYTFADYSLEQGRRKEDFVPIDDELAAEELTTLDRWLELDENEARQSVPFVWALRDSARDASVQLHRLAVSRRLALECRDRLDYWRTLQQLGGQRHEASLAPDAVPEDASAAQPISSADREKVAAEIVGRLLHGLLDGESGLLQTDPAFEVSPEAAEPDASEL